jgi:hypothetical protein
MKTTTLYFDRTGPLLQYSSDGLLHIEDLNPSIGARWRLSRKELFCLGWRCIVTAIRGER